MARLNPLMIVNDETQFDREVFKLKPLSVHMELPGWMAHHEKNQQQEV